MLLMTDVENNNQRNASNFDTTMMVTKRERYFDRLGIEGSQAPGETLPRDQLLQRAESRRLSRGLSNFEAIQA